MTINEAQDQIVEEFALYDDWMDKYNYLMELGSGTRTARQRVPETTNT